MEHNVVRRRGKPNRGGGRGNRGGGNRGGGGGRGRGRGRGGDSPRGRGGGGGGRGCFGGGRGGGGGGGRGGGGPGGRGGGGGLGGRKVGDICDEDFSLVDQHDDYDDDVDFEDAPPIASFTPSSGRGKPGRAASAPTSATSVPSAAAPPPPPSSAPRGRRVMQKHKVPMQKLHMSADNQDIVRDMLKQLHGGQDLDLGAAEYGTLDWRANDQYWMKDNRLVIQGTKHNEDEDENNKIYEDYINQKALRKLQKYGFDKSRCRNALDKHGGDIGRSLEYLASKCFNVPLEGSSTTSDNAHTQAEINDAREDEKMVLGEMYPDSFREKVKNHVWTVSLEIPTLDKWCEGKLDKKAKMQQQIEDSKQKKEACRFFLKGSCKFSADNCRYLHQTPDVLERKKQEEANKLKAAKVAIKKDTYTIEVRFPKGNRYPFECPFVLFSCDNSLVPGSVCLHISERLMTEAKAMAEEGTPAVYSLVLIIENEEEINAILKKPEHKFNGPEPMISRKQMLEQLNPPPVQEDRGDEDLELMSRSKEGEEEVVTAKKATQKDIVRKDMNPNEVKRINRTLKERFRQKQDTSAYKKMVEHRRTLPAWGSQAEILKKLRDSQVLVISGMTGCGKSTQVPQFILDSYMHTKGGDCCNIVCTQPRRISAMAVAERVAQERIEAVGGSVGYQIRLESVMSSRTRLLFCTTGILLRRLEGDHKLSGVTHVIVDEVHERSEESDFLMMILRDMLELRPDLRVILMSATLNADLFSEYFHDCDCIDIPGKTFPVEQYFLEDAIQMTRYVLEEKSKFARPLKSMNAVRQDNLGKDNRSLPLQDIETALANINVQSVAPPKDNICDENLSVPQLYRRYSGYKKSTIKTMALMDYEKINYDLIERLVEYIVEGDHELPEEGAVLVFLPGMAEITTMYEQLRGNKLLSRRKTRLIPLHSTLSSEEQKMVFNKPPEGTTKIVLATNIAETSITIDDIVFVIDAGRMKEKRYDASKGMESLDTVWVSRANAMQRSGRAGRVCKGVCFHLFSGHRFDFNMRDQPIPEIQRAPLEQIILKIKMLQIFSGNDVKMVLAKLIEGPAESSIDTALQRLHDLGALDDAWQLTALGIHLAALPVDVRIGKLMLFGAIFRCLDPALTIAACLSFKSPFVAPFGKKEEADAKKLTFATGNSDHLTMWKAYKEWMEKEKNSSYSGYTFCQENYLSIKSLQMLASMKRQFVELLSDIGFVQEGLTARDVERIGGRGRRGDGVAQATGQLANVNSENMKLVAAILVAALYPNIVQISVPENKYMQVGAGAVPTAPKAQEIKFRTKQDGYINIHPSSVNFQVRFYESPYLVYHEKVKTSKVYVRDCSMVSVYPLLLFAGGAISVDLHDGQFVLSVDDGWIRFLAESHEVAELVRGMRQEMDQLLQDKIENPSLDLCNCPRGNTIISVIVKLISTQ